MIPLGVIARGPAAAASNLILAGITGAVAEWDGEDSPKTGSPVTQWDDLIGSNHAVADSTTAPALTSVGGRAALDFSTASVGDFMGCGALTLPTPASGGCWMMMCYQPDGIAAGLAIGANMHSDGSAGAAIRIEADGTVRGYIGDTTARTFVASGAVWAVVGTSVILQFAYNLNTLKLKKNNDSPLTTSHSRTTGMGGQPLGLGRASASNTSIRLNGKVRWTAYATGYPSDADMSTVATRLNTRFAVF